jgi:hypothetical protein
MSARILIVTLAAASVAPAFGQTQPMRPSAYATMATMHSAWPTEALSPCPKIVFIPTLVTPVPCIHRTQP